MRAATAREKARLVAAAVAYARATFRPRQRARKYRPAVRSFGGRRFRPGLAAAIPQVRARRLLSIPGGIAARRQRSRRAGRRGGRHRGSGRERMGWKNVREGSDSLGGCGSACPSASRARRGTAGPSAAAGWSRHRLPPRSRSRPRPGSTCARARSEARAARAPRALPSFPAGVRAARGARLRAVDRRHDERVVAIARRGAGREALLQPGSVLRGELDRRGPQIVA